MTKTDKNLYSFHIFLFIPFYYLYITTIPFQQKKQKTSKKRKFPIIYVSFLKIDLYIYQKKKYIFENYNDDFTHKAKKLKFLLMFFILFSYL